jgi:hypothetical protein
MVRDGETLPPQRYTKTGRLQSRTIDDFIDPGRVIALFDEGATIVLQAVHRYWAPVSVFCRELEIALTHPVQTNVYVTPPTSRGLDIHYDTHDVFVLQVSGVKHWKVWGRAIEQPLAHQRRKGRYSDPGTPSIDVELKPGDCLYIPRGFLHAAETAESESSHMTVGILTYTWMDVAKRAMEIAAGEVFMRDALPPGFAESPADIEQQARLKLAELGRWIEGLDPVQVVGEVADRFWSNRAPVLGGMLQQTLAIGSVDDATTVKRRPGATARVCFEGEELTLTLGDRRLTMPAWLREPVAELLGRSEMRVGELEPWLNEGSRLVLVRRLIREGVLEQSGGV